MQSNKNVMLTHAFACTGPYAVLVMLGIKRTGNRGTRPAAVRLASLALGTGDIDCVYHFALYELLEAVREFSKDGREDIVEQLESLVDGKRLKDISDLPLDLAC